MKNNILIIGAGPAGVSLATYLKRFNIPCMVFDNNMSNLNKAHNIENYYGFTSISGQELYLKGKEKLKELDIDLINDDVISIEYMNDFVVKTTKNVYEGKILVLASGLAKKSLILPHLAQFEGKGVSYCATCDGFFYRKKKIAIIGSTSYMEEELNVLKRLSDDITIFSNGNEYQNNDFKVIEDKIIDIDGIDNQRIIKTEANDYSFDGIFIAEGNMGSFQIIKHLGIGINQNGEVIVDQNYMTNIPNCYAIGDIIPNIKQIGIAQADGIKLSYHLLKMEKKEAE